MIKWIRILLCLPFFVGVFFSFVSCKEKRAECAKESLSGLEKVDTSLMKKSVVAYVRSYISENPKVKSFLLIPTSLFKDTSAIESLVGERCLDNRIFIIRAADGSTYKGKISTSANFPSRYFEIDGRIVFVASDNDALYLQDALKKVYQKHEMISASPLQYFIVYYTTDKVVPLRCSSWDIGANDSIKDIYYQKPRLMMDEVVEPEK